MGLIEILTSGFRLVQRRLWLILLPLALDGLLWAAPQISVQGALQSVFALWPQAGLPADASQLLGQYEQLLMGEAERFSLLWLLSNSLTWLNALVPGLPALARPDTAGIEVPLRSLALWTPVVLALGLGLGSAYLTMVASQLLPDPQPIATWVRRSLTLWLRVVVYAFLLLAFLAFSVFLLSLVLAVMLMVSPALAGGVTALAALLASWVFLWIFFMLYFVVAALASDGIGLGAAIVRSANVVARNLWSTLGLVLLTTVILGGFQLIFQRLSQLGPVLAGVSIAGNAFLLTGLTAARLIFYQDRFNRWQTATAAGRKKLQPPSAPF